MYQTLLARKYFLRDQTLVEPQKFWDPKFAPQIILEQKEVKIMILLFFDIFKYH